MKFSRPLPALLTVLTHLEFPPTFCKNTWNPALVACLTDPLFTRSNCWCWIVEWQQHSQKRCFLWHFMGLAVSPNEFLTPSAPAAGLLSQQLGASLTQCGTSKYYMKQGRLLPATSELGTLYVSSLSPVSLFFYSSSFLPCTPSEEWFSFNSSVFGNRFLLSHPGVKGMLRSCWAIHQDLKHISVDLM